MTFDPLFRNIVVKIDLLFKYSPSTRGIDYRALVIIWNNVTRVKSNESNLFVM